MMCILIVEVQSNCVLCVWSWETTPASQVLPIVVLANVSHFLWKEYCGDTDSFGWSEVHSKTILCELYVVNFWEGMV